MISRRRQALTVLCLAALAGGTLLATGCSRTAQYRHRPTPGVFSSAQTKPEAYNNWYYMVNSNTRALIDDWGRFTLISRPSRMVNLPTAF